MHVLNGDFAYPDISVNSYKPYWAYELPPADFSWNISSRDGAPYLILKGGNAYGSILNKALGIQGYVLATIKQSIQLDTGYYTLKFRTLRRITGYSDETHSLIVDISNTDYTILTPKTHNGFDTSPASQTTINVCEKQEDWNDDKKSLKSYNFIVFNTGEYTLQFNALGIGTPTVNDSTIFLTDIRITKTPFITNITEYNSNSNSFQINFTTTTSPDNDFSYKYSLDGGINFITPFQPLTSSPITVSGIRPNTIYRVVIKYSSSAGDSSISNMVPAIIRSTIVPVNSGESNPAPVINSITNDGTSFTVNYTQEQISGNPAIPATTYYYSLDGGITFNQTSVTNPNPFTITSGIQKNMVYKVVMKHYNASGYSPNSNMVPAIILRHIPSNSNSISPYYYYIDNSNITLYYPFDTDSFDYRSGVGVRNVESTDSKAEISNECTVLTSGSMHFKAGNINGIQIPNPTISNNGVTIAYWAKIIYYITPQRIFEFYSYGENINNLFLCVDLNSSGTFYLYYTGFNVGSTNYTLRDTDWHHYCYTISSSSEIRFYVDGSNTMSSTANASYNPNLSFSFSRIGGSYYAPEPQNAYMNQFVMFNRALNTTEIGYLSNPLDVRFTSNSTGLSSLPPVITSITNDGSSFKVFFTQNTTGSPTAYFYSLDGGITFATGTSSPIIINRESGIRSKIVYKVVIKNRNSAGDSKNSNMMPAVLP